MPVSSRRWRGFFEGEGFETKIDEQSIFSQLNEYLTGNKPSEYTKSRRFCHGFVLGLMVDLADRYSVTSNRESGFGCYDVMLEQLNEKDDAIIHDLDDEKTLDETVRNALEQTEENITAHCSRQKELRLGGYANMDLRFKEKNA